MSEKRNSALRSTAKLCAIFMAVLLGAVAPRVCPGATVLWNTFEMYDFGSWVEGMHLLQAGGEYVPGIAILATGDIFTGDNTNADSGGSYWVYSYFGDTLTSFEDYMNREMAADIGYTSKEVRAGANFNGHEDSNGHTYLAVIGFTSGVDIPDASPDTMPPYYGWVELDGVHVVSSAITGDGPLVIGTGYMIPEPAGGVLLLLGAAALLLRRRREAAFVASGAEDENVVVQVDVGDCPGRAPQFTMRTTTMHEVKIYPCAISRTGRPPPTTAAQVNSMLDEVNVIYRQVGMHFSLGAPLRCVTNESWATDGLIDVGVRNQIRNFMSGKDGLEIYFIQGKSIRTEPLGMYHPSGIIVRSAATAHTIAHEIGHACGWRDIYCGSGDEVMSELYEGVRQSWMPEDWSNGTGCRFYDLLLPQYQAIRRVLMYGIGSDLKCDIPSGSVYGRSEDGLMENINVGRNTMMTASPKSQ